MPRPNDTAAAAAAAAAEGGGCGFARGACTAAPAAAADDDDGVDVEVVGETCDCDVDDDDVDDNGVGAEGSADSEAMAARASRRANSSFMRSLSRISTATSLEPAWERYAKNLKNTCRMLQSVINQQSACVKTNLLSIFIHLLLPFSASWL